MLFYLVIHILLDILKLYSHLFVSGLHKINFGNKFSSNAAIIEFFKIYAMIPYSFIS